MTAPIGDGGPLASAAPGARRRRRPGRGFVALATVALLVAGSLAFVVGLGDGDDGQPSLIARSVDAAEAAGSARMSVTFAMEGSEPLPPELQGSFAAEGVTRFDEVRLAMTMDMSSFPGAPADAEMELRMVDSIMYMRVPGMQEAAGLAAEWFSFDVEAVSGLDVEELVGIDAATGNPAQQLDYLRGASDDFTEVGREDVRGVTTTHYRATVDLRKALADAPESAREFLEQTVEQFERDLGTTEMDTDIWIDDDGLPRRMSFAMPVPESDGAPPGTVLRVTTDVFDFGVEVDLEPPPPDQVVDITQMLVQQSQVGA